MRSKLIFFFTVLTDIKPILEEMECLFSLIYYKTGLFDFKPDEFYNSIFDVPNIGFTDRGDWNYTDTYLVMPKEEPLKVRKVAQRVGGFKYAIDQQENPNSIILNLGGQYLKKDEIIVAGKIGTISDTFFSLDYLKKFSSKIRKFKKVGSFYVGPTAEEKVKHGWRLVTDEGRDKAYDLIFQ
jgi:hypothetical protein